MPGDMQIRKYSVAHPCYGKPGPPVICVNAVDVHILTMTGVIALNTKYYLEKFFAERKNY